MSFLPIRKLAFPDTPISRSAFSGFAKLPGTPISFNRASSIQLDPILAPPIVKNDGCSFTPRPTQLAVASTHQRVSGCRFPSKRTWTLRFFRADSRFSGACVDLICFPFFQPILVDLDSSWRNLFGYRIPPDPPQTACRMEPPATAGSAINDLDRPTFFNKHR